MLPHQDRAEGEDPLLQPAVQAIFSAHRDSIGLLGHKGSLLAQLLTTETLGSPLQSSFAAAQPPTSTDVCGPSSPAVGLCSCPHCTAPPPAKTDLLNYEELQLYKSYLHLWSLLSPLFLPILLRFLPLKGTAQSERS